MKTEEFSTLAEMLLSECINLLTRKSKDYAQASDDRLINFKSVGTQLGLSPQQVLLTYAHKHIDSINQAIQANPTNPATSTEPLKERIKDVINYMVLLHALNVESNDG